MFDVEDLLLAPVYDLTGSPATLTDKAGTHFPVTVLDHRDGIDLVTAKGGTTNQNLIPGISAEQAVAYVRHSECAVRPIGWTLAFDGEDLAYEVRNVKLKGRPGKGEWVLVLQEAEED